MRLLSFFTGMLLGWLGIQGALAADALSPRQWAEQGMSAMGKKDRVAAIRAFEMAIEGGFRTSNLFYSLACGLALEGKREEALTALEKSVALGFRWGLEASADPDLASLREGSAWEKLVEAMRENERSYRANHSDPEKCQFVSSDIALFWRVYDQLPSSDDPAGLLERQYLDQGSPGLRDFVQYRIQSGKNLYKTIQAFPKYYAAIRKNTEKVGEVEVEVRKSLRLFKDLYPDALFPDIYFVIGAMSSGGTASPEGLLMGTELFSRSAEVPVDELSSWLQKSTKSIEVLPNIVVHELMHFQQRLKVDSLLSASLQEGAADFLASLLSKGNFNEHIYQFGYQHEAALKKEFLAEMAGKDFSRWLYNGDGSVDRPADLGYFMGFRIVQAYYERAKDKKQAIKDILTMEDAKPFFEASGYGSEEAEKPVSQ